MNTAQQLEDWVRTFSPHSPFVSVQAVQHGLGWSPETLNQALATLAQTMPFYADPHQWVNLWAPMGPEALVTYLCPDGYLSGEWALSWHGCLSQQPTHLMIVDHVHPAISPRALTPQWSFECVPALFDEPATRISRPPLLPIATAAQALLDWAEYRWRRHQGEQSQLANFLDDCDRDVVEAELVAVAQTSMDERKQRLADLLLKTWPGESRWPIPVR